MPVPPYEPQPDLHTQRVPGGRRAAFVVVVVAFVVVGTLIWKPWDSGTPAASPAPSQRLTAIVTASPVPTPSAAPEHGSVLNHDPGFATLVTGEGTFVQCTYEAKGKGGNARRVLSAMTVAPPIVGLNEVNDVPEVALVDSVTWHVDVEANSLSGIFSADWYFVTSSPQQSVSIAGDRPTFNSIDIDLPASSLSSDNATVYRATVVVGWVDRSGDLLQGQSINPTSYGPSDDQRAVPMVEGCPENLAAR